MATASSCREISQLNSCSSDKDVLLSQATSETDTFSCYLCLRMKSTLKGLPALSGRKESATVGRMARMPWATRVLQWLGQ